MPVVPELLIGIPINFADCLIGSPITWHCTVQDEMDPAYALLFEHVRAPDPAVRLHAVMGLALAYAGTQKEEVRPVQRQAPGSPVPRPAPRWMLPMA